MAYAPILGPRHPMVSCPRCGCCSLREPTDPESCCGPCTPCGHHPVDECPHCEAKEREIRELRNFIQDIVLDAKSRLHIY